ncbi:hypothetical protein FQA39_LY10905 [Lamprigera yunnana]|nr:hypothetical protein FQA39_LY10905 [Lamprigera yunnana]
MKACRTCLKVLLGNAEYYNIDNEDTCNTGLPSLRSKLQMCIPEMSLDIIESAVICLLCLNSLNAAYDFKSKCLDTEEKIYNYCQSPLCNNSDTIDIMTIVQDGDNYGDVNVHYPIQMSEEIKIEPNINVTYPSRLPFSPEFDVVLKSTSAEDVDSGYSNQFCCTYCPESFEQQSNLKAHVDMHIASRPYECGECNKRFLRKDKLMLHTRVHTGEKPFKCTICERSFSRKDKMNNHMRTHTGEKPHQCILCQKCFSRKDKMNTHMRSKHWLALANLEITVVKHGNTNQT